MKHILLYESGKDTPKVWDISTPAQVDAAFLALFKHLDIEWNCYEDLKDVPWDGQHSKQQILYESAKTGNAESAKRLLNLRDGEEYESWQILDVET